MAVILVPLLQFVSLIFLARALLSWFPIGRDSPFFALRRLVEGLTEPVLVHVRRIMPRTGQIDLSVIAVLLIISFVLTPIAASL